MTGRTVRDVELVNQRGLHARASAAFMREALKYKARVRVTYRDETVNAVSIMDLLMLDARFGQVISIETEGPDAAAALDALCALVERMFDEDE
jgi:phosphocarrier protein HPr